MKAESRGDTHARHLFEAVEKARAMEKGISVSELADAIGVDRTVAHRVLAKLVRIGQLMRVEMHGPGGGHRYRR